MCGAYASIQSRRGMAIPQTQDCPLVASAGTSCAASGQVPPIYPVDAGGFRPNKSAQTSGFSVIGVNCMKNQSINFVARAMHYGACGRIGRPGINSIPHVKEICNVCTFQD